MLTTDDLNAVWADALREHALKPLPAGTAQYDTIGERSLSFLEALWKARTTALPDVGAMIEAGKTVRFWADPHFGHDNIRRLASRTEFRDVEDMDRAIWENLELAMVQSDLIVCLGDMAMKNPLAVHQRMNAAFGAKQLTIVGNHDVKGGASADAWAKCGAAASLAFSLPLDLLRSWIAADDPDEAERIAWKSLPSRVNFGCSHWPVPVDRLPAKSWVNLHGHIHNRKADVLRINCSVEAIGYHPRTLRELLTPDIFESLACGG